MFYNKQAMEAYKKTHRRMDFEKFGILIVIGAAYYLGDITLAFILTLLSIVWTLFDIQKLLCYQNFMKEKEIGLHEQDT